MGTPFARMLPVFDGHNSPEERSGPRRFGGQAYREPVAQGALGPVWSRANAFAHGVPFAFPSSPDIGRG